MQALKGLLLRTLPPGARIRLQKAHYVRQLRRFSERDEADVTILRRLVTPGDHVVDIGAHVGWYTKVLSEAVGRSGTVFSIEPIPSTFAILRHCVQSLELMNVVTWPYAISDEDRIAAVMHVPRQADGYNFYQSTIDAREPGARDLRFPVELRSIDGLFENRHDDISFIKCDVEGHDLKAITGASRLLKRCMPALLIEVSGDPDVPGTQAHQLFAILRDLGYSAWWYDAPRLCPHRRGDRPINHFFLTEKHIARLAAEGIDVGQGLAGDR